jgi:hypothetical protein
MDSDKRKDSRKNDMSTLGFNFAGQSLRGMEVTAVLRDLSSMLDIHEICGERLRLYSSVSSFIMRRGEGKPCYLLDFDVIYGYLNSGLSGKSTYTEMDYFFESSDVDYAIPKGAYEELSAYLKTAGLDRFFNEVTAPTMSEDELVSRLENLIEPSKDPNAVTRSVKEKCIRLLSILANDRFRGIVSEYDPGVKKIVMDQFESDLNSKPWIYAGGKQLENMERDATNLAIVFSQQSEKSRISTFTDYWFVLLTATGAVNRVARSISQKLSVRQWGSVKPRIVVLADLLDFEENDSRAGSVIRAITEGWQRLEGKVYKQIQILKHEAISDLEIEVLASDFESDITTLLASEGSVKSEKMICQLRSIEDLQSKQVGFKFKRTPKRESLRILDTLRGALSKLDPNDKYEINRISDTPSSRNFGIRPEEKSFGQDLLLTLRFLFDGSVSKGLWADWDICCDDHRFVDGLSELSFDLEVPNSKQDRYTAKIVDDDNSHEYLMCDGVIVSNSAFSFYLKLHQIEALGGWSILLVENIYHLQKYLGKILLKEDCRWSDADSLVHEIRIKLSQVVITYEIVPKDKSCNRRLTVFSSSDYNVFARYVSTMYDLTGMRFAYKPVLERAIKEAIRANIS